MRITVYTLVLCLVLPIHSIAKGDKVMPKVHQENERYKKGWAMLNKLDEHAATAVQESLRDIAPDMGRFIVEFGYGDIYSRPALGLEWRQITTIAALAALGNAAPQLRFHIGAALNVGCTPEEIIEVMYLVGVFSGFPAALNGIKAASEVFDSRGIKLAAKKQALEGTRRARAERALAGTSGGSGEAIIASLKDIAPDMADYILDFAYGDIIARQVLSAKEKEIVMIASATARGTMAPQLAVHIKAGLNVGLTKQEIVEVIQQIAVYAGFPAALNGLDTAKKTFKELLEKKLAQ